jgi:hypothetical protein
MDRIQLAQDSDQLEKGNLLARQRTFDFHKCWEFLVTEQLLAYLHKGKKSWINYAIIISFSFHASCCVIINNSLLSPSQHNTTVFSLEHCILVL